MVGGFVGFSGGSLKEDSSVIGWGLVMRKKVSHEFESRPDRNLKFGWPRVAVFQHFVAIFLSTRFVFLRFSPTIVSAKTNVSAMAIRRLSISFFLNKQRRTKSGKYPLYLRIVFDRKKAELRLDDELRLEDWNFAKQEPRDPRLKEYLAYTTEKIYGIKRDLGRDQNPVSAAIIKECFTKGLTPNKSRTLIDYLEGFTTKISLLGHEYAPGTVQHYKTAVKHLQSFLKWFEKPNVMLRQFSIKLVSEFDFYMKTQVRSIYGKPLSRNTANKYHKKLRQMLAYAVKTGLIDSNPYNDFAIKDKKVVRDYLTEDEVYRIENLRLNEFPWLDKARDVFLFSVYTGLRYGDAIRLRRDNIERDIDGNYWMNLHQEKTNEVLSVPMTSKASNIYIKYAEQSRMTGQVLPSLANQRINIYLKTIQEMTGIRKNITHHVARHTFATLALKNGAPLEIVGKMLGHTSIKSTLVYAQITQELMLENVELLNVKVFAR